MEPAANGGPRGIGLLSGDTAAIVLTEQTQASAASYGPVYALSDLRGRDLRQVDLSKLDLRGADLSGANLSGKNLAGLNLSGTTLANANLDGADLTGAKLDGVEAADASFNNARFLDTSMDNAEFSRAKFRGAYFGGVDRNITANKAQVAAAGKQFNIESSTFRNADFTGATFMYSEFRQADLNGAKFDGVEFFESSITGQSTVKNASFQGIGGHLSIGNSDASGADFRNINISGNRSARIIIGQSKVDDVSFAGSRVTLSLSDLDLRKVDLSVRNRDLSGSTFANNIMAGKNFKSFNFADATFINSGRGIRNSFVDREDADMKNMLEGADFGGANFANATFYKFDLRQALVDAGAIDSANHHGDQTKTRYVSDMLEHFEQFRRDTTRSE